MELASTVIQYGARSDRPVGEHPSRQWSCQTAMEIFPEMMKCPIHIAVEQGHVKMVDLFVRQSILCTQIADPLTGYLPYRTALSHSLSSKTKEEKQRYRVIYFYLYDKQFNLKVPLNATGEYVSNLLTSTISANAVHRSSTNLVFVSLPFYCRIISWYERAREKAWKKYGGRFYNSTQSKRVYAKQGLLGYKVLIDGYNNTFEVPTEQLRIVRSGGTVKSENTDRYIGFTNEEREKIVRMKNFVKDFALDDRKRAKQIAAANLQQARRPHASIPQSSAEQNKRSYQTSASSELTTNLKRSHTIVPDIKAFQSILDIDNSSITDLTPSTLVSVPSINKRLSKTAHKFLPTRHIEEKNTLPKIVSPMSNYTSITNKLDTVIQANKREQQSSMSSVDAYAFTSRRVNLEAQQRRTEKRRQLLADIEESIDKQLQLQDSTEKSIQSVPVSASTKSNPENTEGYIPLPERPSLQRSSPIKSRLDVDIRQSAVKPYERHASATTRSTAVHCLQEAGYFKGKSWLKQVEISKEMVKHHVKRRIRRADDGITKKPILLPIRMNMRTTASTKVN